MPVFDGHNDTLTRIYGSAAGSERAFLDGDPEGHIDLPRARAGHLAGGIFAIMAPADPAGRRVPVVVPGHIDPADATRYLPVDGTFAQRYATAVTASLLRLQRDPRATLQVVHDAAELRACLDSGTIAVVLHFEGAEAIDPQLNSLEVFYAAGLRSLGLVWSRPNIFAEGVPFRFPASPDTGAGLTKAGFDLVKACNELGIVVDLSHLNALGFWDVVRTSSAPLVASHSNAHALCPSTRNLLDDQLRAVSESGGLVGVNFAVHFLTADGGADGDAGLQDLVDHFEYLAERMGIDHVGFGTDFDGARIPTVVGDARGLQKVIEALRGAGFSDADLRKVAHENWMRVLSQTWH